MGDVTQPYENSHRVQFYRCDKRHCSDAIGSGSVVVSGLCIAQLALAQSPAANREIQRKPCSEQCERPRDRRRPENGHDSQRNQGELQLQLNYKPYEDDEEVHDAYSDRESFAVAQQEAAITDVKSAAGALRDVHKRA